MDVTLVVAHGWGFDADSLRPLADALERGGVRTALVEDGQLGAAPRWPEPDGAVAILGHSAGFPALLRGFGERCRAAVAVNGFTRFAAGPGFAEGVPERVLSRMAGRLERGPVAVVEAFRAGHGAPPLPSGCRVDPGRLAAGLRRLAADDQRPAMERLRARGTRVLALCAGDDPLVGPEHARACFRDDEIRWEEGGHLLPLRFPERCAQVVAGFLGGDRPGAPLPLRNAVR